MKSNIRFTITAIASLTALTFAGAGTMPQRVGNFNHPATTNTGLVEASGWTGSGVVMRHPKVVVTCAHNSYDARRGQYTSLRFHLRHNSRGLPSRSGQRMRGYHRWTGYARDVGRYGDGHQRTLHRDLLACYSYANYNRGRYAGWYYDGEAMLRSRHAKVITGYPSGYSRNRYQHYVGLFGSRFEREYGRFHWTDAVGTGSGNSGGPVFVEDSRGRYAVAGIVVAGNPNARGVGVLAFDDSARGLIGNAVANANKSRSSSSAKTISLRNVRIPDGSPSWRRPAMSVSGARGTITGLSVSFQIAHARYPQVEMYLRTPSGKFILLYDGVAQVKGKTVLTVSNRNLASKVRGLNANGTWKLWVRDPHRGTAGSVRSFSARITSK